MPKNKNVLLHMNELCQLVDIPAETIVSFVEYGIVEPSGNEPDEWVFDVYVVSVVKRAYRLQRDFDIDTSAVALVLDLLDKQEKLQTENKMLRQRLSRFLDE